MTAPRAFGALALATGTLLAAALSGCDGARVDRAPRAERVAADSQLAGGAACDSPCVLVQASRLASGKVKR